MAKRIKKTTKKVVAGANTITEGIINTLLIDGHSASRINVQGQYVEHLYGPDKGGYRPSGSRNGFSDISCTVKPTGRHLCIEVKWKGDEQSPEQITFQKEHEAAGGIYIIIRTWLDWQLWYAEFKENNYQI